MQALANNPNVLKEFYRICNENKLSPKDVLKESITSSWYLFSEIFTYTYNLEIVFKKNCVMALKGSINIFTISLPSAATKDLMMLITVALVNYCEKPF